jgi:hypothetical protein
VPFQLSLADFHGVRLFVRLFVKLFVKLLLLAKASGDNGQSPERGLVAVQVKPCGYFECQSWKQRR